MHRRDLSAPSSDSATLATEYRARLRAALIAERVPATLRHRFELCISELDSATETPSFSAALSQAVALLDAVAFRR